MSSSTHPREPRELSIDRNYRGTVGAEPPGASLRLFLLELLALPATAQASGTRARIVKRLTSGRHCVATTARGRSAKPDEVRRVPAGSKSPDRIVRGNDMTEWPHRFRTMKCAHICINAGVQ